jgi:hypothetical protein
MQNIPREVGSNPRGTLVPPTRLAVTLTLFLALSPQAASAQFGSPNSSLPPDSPALISLKRLASKLDVPHRQQPTKFDAARELTTIMSKLEYQLLRASLREAPPSTGPRGPSGPLRPISAKELRRRQQRTLVREDVSELGDLITFLTPELNSLDVNIRSYRALLAELDDRIFRLEQALARMSNQQRS